MKAKKLCVALSLGLILVMGSLPFASQAAPRNPDPSPNPNITYRLEDIETSDTRTSHRPINTSAQTSTAASASEPKAQGNTRRIVIGIELLVEGIIGLALIRHALRTRA
jgi:hypothetical protein